MVWLSLVADWVRNLFHRNQSSLWSCLRVTKWIAWLLMIIMITRILVQNGFCQNCVLDTGSYEHGQWSNESNMNVSHVNASTVGQELRGWPIYRRNDANLTRLLIVWFVSFLAGDILNLSALTTEPIWSVPEMNLIVASVILIVMTSSGQLAIVTLNGWLSRLWPLTTADSGRGWFAPCGACCLRYLTRVHG